MVRLAVAASAGRGQLPTQPVLLSFDDGYASVYCQAHGGAIQVTSAPGRGCRFLVELPLAGAARSGAGQA